MVVSEGDGGVTVSRLEPAVTMASRKRRKTGSGVRKRKQKSKKRPHSGMCYNYMINHAFP